MAVRRPSPTPPRSPCCATKATRCVNAKTGREMSHVGSCFCGAITLEVAGSPEAMGYCYVLSVVVGWPGQRLQPVEAAGRTDRFGRRARRDVREDMDEPTSILPQVRRALDDHSPGARPGGCVRRDDPDADLHPRRSRQLRRDRAAHAGWP